MDELYIDGERVAEDVRIENIACTTRSERPDWLEAIANTARSFEELSITFEATARSGFCRKTINTLDGWKNCDKPRRRQRERARRLMRANACLCWLTVNLEE